jgi:hypothetical protein
MRVSYSSNQLKKSSQKYWTLEYLRRICFGELQFCDWAPCPPSKPFDDFDGASHVSFEAVVTQIHGRCVKGVLVPLLGLIYANCLPNYSAAKVGAKVNVTVAGVSPSIGVLSVRINN